MKIVLLCDGSQADSKLARALNDSVVTAPDGFAPQIAAKHSLVVCEGGSGQLRVLANSLRPDLIFIEGIDTHAQTLESVEFLTQRSPRLGVVLVAAQPTPDFLMRAMRAGVLQVISQPVSASIVEAAISHAESRLGLPRKSHRCQILAFVAAKGGSGCTFLASNLAHQMALRGKKTLLLDLNLQFGEAIHSVWDGAVHSDIAQLAGNVGRLDPALLDASVVTVAQNFSVLAAAEDPLQAPEVLPAHLDSILNVACARYDCVVLDLDRTLNAVSLQALDRADKIFLIVQASLPFLRNAKKMISVFRALGFEAEKTAVLVNRFERNSEISLQDLRTALGAASFHTVPNDYRPVATAINQGQALANGVRSTGVAKAISELANSLLGAPERRTGSLLSRWLKL